MVKGSRLMLGAWLMIVASAVAGRAAERDPALVAAVKAGDPASVRALLQQRVDVNAREADGTSALHWAVRAGDAATVDLLIRAGAQVNAVNRYGVTPLSVAARSGQGTLITALLKAGAAIKAADATLPEGHTLLMLAARTGDVASVKALVAGGADVNARETRTGTTALVWAAAEDRADVVRVLVESGASLNVASTITAYPHTQNGVGLSGIEDGVSYVGQTVLPRGGWTAVMFAAREGAVRAVAALADAGADLNATDPEGTSALVIAVINGRYDVVQTLVGKGANPNIADIKGMTPLYAAVDMHTIPTTFGRPYPPHEVIEGSVGAVKTLLAGGADPNARLTGPILKRVYNPGDNRLGEGATPFMRAARGGDVLMMKLLLEGGADPKLAQKNGNTPLILAAGAGSGRGSDNNPDRVTEDQAIAAIKLGLEMGLDINAANAAGETVAHTASTTNLGSPGIIRFLFENGAKFDARNKAGRTPLEAVLRARERSDDTVALLRQLTGVTEDQTPADPAASARDADRDNN